MEKLPMWCQWDLLRSMNNPSPPSLLNAQAGSGRIPFHSLTCSRIIPIQDLVSSGFSSGTFCFNPEQTSSKKLTVTLTSRLGINLSQWASTCHGSGGGTTWLPDLEWDYGILWFPQIAFLFYTHCTFYTHTFWDPSLPPSPFTLPHSSLPRFIPESYNSLLV